MSAPRYVAWGFALGLILASPFVAGLLDARSPTGQLVVMGLYALACVAAGFGIVPSRRRSGP
jgi:uncharacterized membrane protein YccC